MSWQKDKHALQGFALYNGWKHIENTALMVVTTSRSYNRRDACLVDFESKLSIQIKRDVVSSSRFRKYFGRSLQNIL